MSIDQIGPLVPPQPNPGEDALMKKLDRMARNATGGTADAAKDKALRSACEEFESYFMYSLMKEMRKTVPETAFMHGGRAEEIFRDMMDEEMAKRISHTPGAGIGIADMLYRQLSRQSIAQPAATEDGKKE